MSSYDLQQLTAAFESEGFKVVNNVRWNGKLGVAAEHGTAFSGGDPQKPKKAFYLEGTHREMGHLLGLMAEEDIREMATHFVDNMVWELFFWHPRAKADPHDDHETDIMTTIKAALGEMFARLIAVFTQPVAPGAAPAHLVPPEYLQEIDGILDGCRAANPDTGVNKKDLLVLNFGIDWFLGNVYSMGGIFKTLRRSVMCNGFSLSKAAAGNEHFFGRDFMFPTAGIFGERACHIIGNPEDPGAPNRLPFVSLTAPGMVGSVTGMNRRGVAIGVEVVPSMAADVRKVGLNSLVLNRDVVERAADADAAVAVIINAPRTVPWIYIVADGTTDKACVVETVDARDQIDFVSFPPKSTSRNASSTGILRSRAGASWRATRRRPRTWGSWSEGRTTPTIRPTWISTRACSGASAGPWSLTPWMSTVTSMRRMKTRIAPVRSIFRRRENPGTMWS